MIKQEYWASGEDEYVDVWCCALVEVLCELKLVSTKTSNEMWSVDSKDLYDMLWRYKENDSRNHCL